MREGGKRHGPSRLDYCNGLLGGAPKYLLGQLSGIMRAAARLVLVLPRMSHMTDCDLHEAALARCSCTSLQTLCACLSMSARSAPPYLADYFVPVGAIEGRSNLRSAAAGQLCVPRTKTVIIGPRAFAVFSPTTWNRLGTISRLIFEIFVSGRSSKLIYSTCPLLINLVHKIIVFLVL